MSAIVVAAREMAKRERALGRPGELYDALADALEKAKKGTQLQRRAKVVLQAACDWVSDTDGCHFCCYSAEQPFHDPTCPLVCRL